VHLVFLDDQLPQHVIIIGLAFRHLWRMLRMMLVQWYFTNVQLLSKLQTEINT